MTASFRRGYMVPVTIPQKRKDPIVVDEDSGVFPTTRMVSRSSSLSQKAASSPSVPRRTPRTGRRA